MICCGRRKIGLRDRLFGQVNAQKANLYPADGCRARVVVSIQILRLDDFETGVDLGSSSSRLRCFL